MRGLSSRDRNLTLRDRADAGRQLADTLAKTIDGHNAIVLALPRGGVPVAYEVATMLATELDLLTVRKLGLPQHSEYAMGAIASGGIRVLNEFVINRHRISDAEIEEVARVEERELARRESAYRGTRPRPDLKNKHVILVDDGIATGSTMQAAVDACKRAQPQAITVAVPVAADTSVRDLQGSVDHVVVLATPSPFGAVGLWYTDFGQTSDEEVTALLAQAWQRGL